MNHWLSKDESTIPLRLLVDILCWFEVRPKIQKIAKITDFGQKRNNANFHIPVTFELKVAEGHSTRHLKALDPYFSDYLTT